MRSESQETLCDEASEAEVEADQSIAGSSGTEIELHKRRRLEKRLFKQEWKMKYLMWPVKGTKNAANNESEMMSCIQCQEQLKAKGSSVVRHLKCKHSSSMLFSNEKRARLVKQFEAMYKAKINHD